MPSRLLLTLLVAVLVSPACSQRRGGPGATSTPPPSPPAAETDRPLSAQDLQVYVAVRDRALTDLEDALTLVERGGGDPVSSVQELGVAEQRAAGRYRVPWTRYTWIRDEIGRLASLQRRAQDARVLALELERTRADLQSQREVARDQASKQFLEAQIARLSVELERLGSERAPTAEELGAIALLDAARAELAVLQGRQEKLQRRLRDLIRRERPVAESPSDAEADRVR